MQQTTTTTEGEYFIHQFNTSCLAQFSYYIESNKEAIVIDPIRDIDIYLDMLALRGATLKQVFETHFHADFVSGHVELSQRTGAKIIYGPTAKPEFEIETAEDNQVYKLGSVNIKVIHTPGHTLESSCFLLLDSKDTPKAVFTGDCLFLGDVGRPDLAVKGDLSETELAAMLYDSVQRLKTLPDNVTIYPGHGAGSACGKNIGSGTSCSVGRQKANNYALNENMSKQEFIELVTSNLPTPPQYFFYDVMMNKKGYELLEPVVTRSLVPFTPEKIFKILSKEPETYTILDSRDFVISINHFIKGSYLIALKMQYAIWTANLLSPKHKIILITEAGKEKESIVRLARVGFENVVGFVEGGFEALLTYANESKNEDILKYFTKLDTPDLSQVNQILEEILAKKENYQILDVREKGEIETTGVIDSDAITIPLGKLEIDENIQRVIQAGENKTIAVHCKTGGRAAVAAAILKRHGVDRITFLGGILNMQEKNVPFYKK